MSYSKCGMGAMPGYPADVPPPTRDIEPVVVMSPPIAAVPPTIGQMPMATPAVSVSMSITPFTMLAIGGVVAYFLFKK